MIVVGWWLAAVVIGLLFWVALIVALAEMAW